MTKSWYKQANISHKNEEDFIKEDLEDIKKQNYTKSILLEIPDEKSKVKKINIIFYLNIHSDDLQSINDGENSPIFLNKDELIYQGFDLDAIDITKKIHKKWNYPTEIWAISKNNKVLHWGALPENHSEWEEMKEEAIEYADTIIKNFKSSSYNSKINSDYIKLYDAYINKFIADQPQGWYVINYNKKELDKYFNLKTIYAKSNKKRKKNNY